MKQYSKGVVCVCVCEGGGGVGGWGVWVWVCGWGEGGICFHVENKFLYLLICLKMLDEWLIKHLCGVWSGTALFSLICYGWKR